MSTLTLKAGLACELNLPEAVKGEGLHSLPPFAPIDGFPLDAFPGCPENWERGGPNDKAFFVEVQKGKGLWINLNPCLEHQNEVAVILSIQGINPINGKPVGKPIMEQYREADVPQNYLATTGTPYGQFWLDGFRGADGEVRQYIFTEETIRGIASQVIGDKRSFSIGIAFFLSKSKKQRVRRSMPIADMNSWILNEQKSPNWENPFDDNTQRLLENTKRGHYGSGKNHNMVMCYTSATETDSNPKSVAEKKNILTEERPLEIAGGSRIIQQIHRDPQRLDFWKPEPEGILYIHYVEPVLKK